MILDKVIDLICSELGLEREEVGENTPLEELIGDDLEATELAMAIEGEFEVDLPKGIGYGDGETVSTLADTVEELLAV